MSVHHTIRKAGSDSLFISYHLRLAMTEKYDFVDMKAYKEAIAEAAGLSVAEVEASSVKLLFSSSSTGDMQLNHMYKVAVHRGPGNDLIVTHS
ncbi:hypothetical protein HDV05_006116 [Chytridiales sp. JEL 0842]|nr:hypothetical protein HDV05_006116 [Chytridiales sp. JEL 0842]